MGLFSFFKREKSNESNKSSLILGMVLLEEADSLNIKGVVSELRGNWKLEVDDSESSDESSVLVVDGYRVAIGNMPVPIPGVEIEETAAYNYLWPNGEKEATKHKGHIILSLMNGGKDPVAENLLFNKVASAVLKNSKSLGVYIGGRSLLISKDFYLGNTEIMSEEDLPLYNWVYFGLRQENGKQSIYTYGLAEFNKKEMEIINSSRTLEELNEIMFNMAHYVIAQDVKLKDGETIGISAEQKLKIKESKGKFLEGNTLKIIY
ncbi:DUF4261 domain-containing protein [Pontibacter ruber]|uniref:DUF4261 domain-containing protein n=1 Tax=Pontibacter ruber TaxID=1343895 RepID=A0ABW5CVT4_9BACT|nr:DUF4261 domain-containing protein [Pontibacter ruber]